MKKTIRLLIIMLVIIIIILMILSKNEKNKDNNKEYINENAEGFIHEITAPEERYSKPKEKYMSNEFEYTNVTIENLILKYFNGYKEDIAFNIDKAYDKLDNEYKQKRFGNIEEYKKFIDSNYERLISSTLNSYQVDKTKSGYTQYICIDQDNNYYIFKETAIMQYKVILDTYTLDLPEFLEKYNSSKNQGKVALNIQKFMQSINAKDYRYAYNCLSEGFKNNYFKTQESFETYIEQHLFQNNKVDYIAYTEDAGLCKYTVNITNSKKFGESIQKTIIMKLNEGTDFELSFDV